MTTPCAHSPTGSSSQWVLSSWEGAAEKMVPRVFSRWSEGWGPWNIASGDQDAGQSPQSSTQLAPLALISPASCLIPPAAGEAGPGHRFSRSPCIPGATLGSPAPSSHSPQPSKASW